MLAIAGRIRRHLDDGTGWLIRYGFGVSKLGSTVHGQATRTTTESVSLGSEFPSIALLAVDLSLVLGAVGAVQPLLAEAAVEASFVPLASGSDHFLSGIH